jgi:hypothetical protein
MVGDVMGMLRLLLISLSSLMLERAVKMRLLFSMARSLARSWVVSLDGTLGMMTAASWEMALLRVTRMRSMPTLDSYVRGSLG